MAVFRVERNKGYTVMSNHCSVYLERKNWKVENFSGNQTVYLMGEFFGERS